MNLQQIYEQHADFVWRTVLRLGVAEAEARDAVQDVFLRVHAHLGEFEGRSSIKTWLFAIARSVARDRRRRARLAPGLAADGELEETVDLRADVGRVAEHHERLLILERILDGMSADQRTVFVLFEVEHFSGEEISEALGAPIGTIYSRLHSARKLFRAAVSRMQAQEHFLECRTGEAS
ncbi:MAG TPA: RNA polymerase sigma factor [Polyangiaceae bacterium]|nr:RNA polymerase sigma factor [Polyangiaceae bacterium]